jgi:hypothetical protein
MIGDNIENDTTFKRDSIYLPRDTLSRAQVNSVVSICGGGGGGVVGDRKMMLMLFCLSKYSFQSMCKLFEIISGLECEN